MFDKIKNQSVVFSILEPGSFFELIYEDVEQSNMDIVNQVYAFGAAVVLGNKSPTMAAFNSSLLKLGPWSSSSNLSKKDVIFMRYFR
jgi:hypothetical protein